MNLINENSPKRSLNSVLIGENVIINDFVNAYKCSIDDGSKVGAFVEIQKNASIGKNCKISSHTFICEVVKIEDCVFVGHNVSFINDTFPRATNDDGSIQTDADWQVMETIVCEGCSIGAGSTILGGIKIGKNAIIGAGSVVTKDVSPDTIVVGNPAKVLRKIK
ncbi:MAG: N-acetyltransferase [Deferribacteraceae bacterium]|jgi:acetyltransferase-like isoleucine patch superfamily enzyme|nr:N-acetyltransferase [Deferribacteraceae bacterium]